MKIHEVSARDGLQNEQTILTTSQKIELLRLLASTSPDSLEVTSFVRADRVPQLADAVELCKRLRDVDWRKEIPLVGLVLNMKGFELFSESGLDAITTVIGANENFSKANAGMSVAKAICVNEEIAVAAKQIEAPLRMYLSMAFGSPSADLEIQLIQELVSASAEMGAERIVLSDTIGVATPNQVIDVLSACKPYIGRADFGLHMHDTYGRALANCEAGLNFGVQYFDASVGGAGGCPFAPGASGNLATGALFALAQSRKEAPQNTSLEAIDKASIFLSNVLGRPLARYGNLCP